MTANTGTGSKMLRLLLVALGCSFLGASPKAPSFYLYPNNEIELSAPFPADQYLPLFKKYGDVAMDKTEILLGKHAPSQQSALWSKRTMGEQSWQVILAFRIRGDAIGGNGLALWYTREGHRTGPVYGGPDRFEGFGLFIDTFDEETKAESVPMVVGMIGNGNTTFRQGSVPNSPQSLIVGSCFKNVRNTEAPVFLKVTYFRRHLKVELDHSREGMSYLTCFENSNVDLPLGYYFGVSSSTNNYPDKYEILAMKTAIFSQVSRHGDASGLKERLEENEIFKDQSTIAQIFVGMKGIQEKQGEMMGHLRSVLGNPTSDLLPVSQRLEALEKDLRHLDNHLDRTEEALHAMMILLKKIAKDAKAQAAEEPEGWKRYQGYLLVLGGQALLLLIYLLLRSSNPAPLRKAI